MQRTIARRLAKFRARLRRLKPDAALITDTVNVRYLSGFTGDGSALLITQSHALFVTDFRYVEQAEAECPGYHVLRRRDGTAKVVAREARKLGVSNLGIEQNVLTLETADILKEELRNIKTVKAGGIVEDLRAIKDRGEILAIRACADAADKALEHVKTFLVPGIREGDIAAELEYFARRLGFDGLSFPPIVAFGPRGSLCHAPTTNRRLRAGEPVLIDCGVTRSGYCSDLTRVFFHNKIPARFRRIYKVVLEAQARAICRVRPGALAKDIDQAARTYIADAGYVRRFGHSLGHGIGLRVHETPSLAAGSCTVLKKGMVFTVEPGIYIPGFGGVRIEDDVLVTTRGAEILSHTPRALNDVIIGG